MDYIYFNSLSVDEQFVEISERPDFLALVIPNSQRTAQLLDRAYMNYIEHNAEHIQHKRASTFVNKLVSLILNIDQLEAIINEITPKKKRSLVLELLLSSDYFSSYLLVELAANVEFIKKIPDYGRWCEILVLRRASILLQDSPLRKFKISELFPLGETVEYSVFRSVLGSAYDEDRLTSDSINQLKELFPNDKYFDF
ncbi:hypothetical protein H0A36_24905 [Endozoicomonas sp. SM1973]|uniref:Uncharacterized protein n=1 Tax=Spartinivicinus marinus TaxID=2994442 RepID=A0A853I7H2_9GAMM|nr:hypothetical protein [Spartinivicinus marinus]MCX4027695.1 hypothetical protein [Spartinivicinus marinus]NYZ69263.1 hypothetical protein [Spartinivicinus marinus]